ncbi:helix-turn-helix transcriptional regulator [Nocardiopsis sp. N85]|uniref:helix-turn-helix domain-containing protein n=1 Tax=Nocardiopsis sp. N85 TaxID=3029400 RepID=UPI00237FD3FA|nr:helix-turn-helix transcriptional regulator [Nocardiopsis sp. N85]MDE3725279.1 helix-turn-helix transcriptional regulator [Nocardiopsis sp. N85]
MTSHPLHQFSPGQRVAWYRIRRGVSQEVLAGLVGRTADWLGKIENDRAPLDRLSVIRSLADALDVSVIDLIGDTREDRDACQRSRQVEAVRSVLMDYRYGVARFSLDQRDERPPELRFLRQEVETVMDAYQASNYQRVLRRLPDLLARTHAAERSYTGERRKTAQALLALASQSCAMVLTKLGETDLAWIATERGLNAAFDCGDPAVQGSLMRSGVHSLHSRGQYQTAISMADDAASYLRGAQCRHTRTPRMLSVYGTLLLPAAVAAARSGDRATANAYLEEAGKIAGRLGRDANHLWTAFGPTNVALHRVTIAGSSDDPYAVLRLGSGIDTAGLPTERRVRHLFELAQAMTAVNRISSAVERLLEAEGLSIFHVHHHMMSHQIVVRLMRTKDGRRDRRLAALAHRMGVV